MQALDLAARLLCEVGVDPARQDGVHLDVLLRPGHRQRLGELHHAALARAISRMRHAAEDRHHRADVDDLAEARAHHFGISRLGGQERAGQVGVDDGVPVLERVFLRALADVGPGVVDEDVEPAQSRGGLRRHPAAVGLSREIDV